LYQFVSEEYADSDRNWATIDAVVRIAREIGSTPAQVALSWVADRPGVTAPIVGARTVELSPLGQSRKLLLLSRNQRGA
jgi:aryl-alcohol dehydrogenase (NADP+)